MFDNYYDDNKQKCLLYSLIIVLGIIFICNITVKIWQISLEKEYSIQYKEAENLSNEYREKYYSMDEAMEYYSAQLERIINNAKEIVKQNIIVIIVEMIFTVITFLPILMMYNIFKNNRKIAYLHPNRITYIILSIEIVISLVTCFMDMNECFETIGKYKQITELVEEMYNGLNSIIDTINF